MSNKTSFTLDPQSTRQLQSIMNVISNHARDNAKIKKSYVVRHAIDKLYKQLTSADKTTLTCTAVQVNQRQMPLS